MLYWLFVPLSDTFIGFNVFRYLTFRTGLAIATAFFISLVFGPWLIAKLRSLQIRQAIREEGPEHHQVKEGTPTMGGVLIVSSFTLTTLLWANLENPYVWTVLLVTLGFAGIGLADDLIKVLKRRNLGLTTRQKLVLQVLVGICGGLAARAAAMPATHAGSLAVPFFKDVPVRLPYSPAPSPVPRLGSCGSTATLPRSSWATWVPWPSAAASASSRWSQSRSSCWCWSAGSSSSKPCRW
jgi:phospho-N-acetylmuramoyl-pentapeptide-transferase